MNEERKMILQMVQDGTISIDEAQRLLEALSADGASAAQPHTLATTDGLSPKRLVVHVSEGGKSKVNIKIPFSLVRVGLKLGKNITALVGKRANCSPEETQAYEVLRSIDIDELLNSINDGEITLPYTLAEVADDESGEQVYIALE